jgi:hypothetical protein
MRSINARYRFAETSPDTLQQVPAIGKHGLARFRRLPAESPAHPEKTVGSYLLFRLFC